MVDTSRGCTAAPSGRSASIISFYQEETLEQCPTYQPAKLSRKEKKDLILSDCLICFCVVEKIQSV